MSETWYLGIDISCDTFDFALLDAQEKVLKGDRLPNTPTGFSALMDVLGSCGAAVSQLHACMEATGVYYQQLAYFLHAAGVKLSVMNPAQIHAFGKSLLRRAKTDRMDAQLIALFAIRQQPHSWVPQTDLLAELQCLTRARDELTTSIVQLKNKKHTAGHAFYAMDFLEEQRQAQLELLERQQKDLERKIKELIQRDQQVKQQLDSLLSLPGVGFKIATVFLSETSLMNFESGSKLVAFAGLNPQIQESGKYRGHASISKKGNTRLRKAAYQAAVCSVKTQSFFSSFYKRLRAKGKPAKVAFVALAHKILCTALAVVKQQSTYQEDFHRLHLCLPEEPTK